VLEPGSVDAVAEGRSTPAERFGLRAAAPSQGGPLGSSGAAPDASADPVPNPEPTPAVGAPGPAGAVKQAVPSQRDPSDKSDNSTVAASAEPSDAASAPMTDAKPAAPGSADAKPAPATTPSDATTLAAGSAGTSSAPGEKTDGHPADGPGAAGTTAVEPAKAATSHALPRTRRNPLPSLGRGLGRAGRGTVAWARRPSGRLILPAVVVLLLVGAAITAGAYYVPKKLKASPAASATPTFAAGAAAPVPSASLPSDAGLPGVLQPSQPTAGVTQPTQQTTAGTGQRPQEVLAGWAETTGTKVGIPVVAVEAYGYAELVLARTTPTCHLSWTTVAAIAEVESDHGHFQNSVLGADGTVSPPIYGLPLNGQGGRSLIADTDHGAIDGDSTYDRAVGPLQFIPSTWASYKVDADNNGVADPQNINDASLTAGIYLCQKGRDLSKPDDWYSAIYSYNAVQPYAQKVFETANDYGQRSEG
jgi:membrane-bound lytic murein transglycosylase B